jgi:hypothetical protein
MKAWAHSISPSDAVVALRSFPRRWRGLLAQAGEEEDPEGVLRRRPRDGSPSVLELLAETSFVLAEADARLREIVVGGGSSAGTTPDRPAAGGADVDSLATVAESLAARVAAVPSNGWQRSGASDTTALDVVRQAVAAASDNLRHAEHTLAQVRGRPG